MKTSPGYTRIPSLSCNTTILRLETRKVLAKLSHFVPQGVVTVSTSLVSASKCWDDNYISPRTPQTTPRPPGIFHFLERTLQQLHTPHRHPPDRSLPCAAPADNQLAAHIHYRFTLHTRPAQRELSRNNMVRSSLIVKYCHNE